MPDGTHRRVVRTVGIIAMSSRNSSELHISLETSVAMHRTLKVTKENMGKLKPDALKLRDLLSCLCQRT